MKNPNGYGTIVKLSGVRRKPYAAKVKVGWTDHGNVKYKYIGYYSSLKEAKQGLAKYNENPYDVDTNKLTLGEIIDTYIRDVIPKLNKNSAVQRVSAFRKFNSIRNMPMKNIKPYIIQDLIDKQDTAPKQKVVYDAWVILEKYAMTYDIGIQAFSPCLTKKSLETKERNPFSEEEIELLWQHTDIPIVRDALIMIYSGWRLTEYLALTKDDIVDGFMIGGTKTESGKNRRVYIHPRIAPLIEENLKNKGYIASRIAPSTLDIDWANCEYTKNHIRHETRHTFRTRLDNANANSVCIDLLMGHKSKSIGERVYTHKTLEQLKETICLLT